MNSNLDVWAIQTLPQELYTALSNIKTDNDIILYTNVKCHFQVGNQIINNRQFDCFLYSEENDLLIMLMKNGNVTATDIINYLNENNLKFNEVTFCENTEEYYNDYDIKEIWFVRDVSVLQDALQDSFVRMTNFGIYYPNVPGYIKLGYSSSYFESFSNQEQCKIYSIEERLFKGVIELEDKLIILLSNNEHHLMPKTIFQLCEKYNILLETRFNHEPIIASKEKQKKLSMTF